MMQEFCACRWWLFALRGVLGVVFGFLALVMPGVTLATLVLLFGAYSLADGAVSLGGAITGRSGGDDRWITGLQGLLGIIVGLVTLFMPGVTALGLLFAIAAAAPPAGARARGWRRPPPRPAGAAPGDRCGWRGRRAPSPCRAAGA
jgi:uncharacterized membrane protein HdeD (DUF308 family)